MKIIFLLVITTIFSMASTLIGTISELHGNVKVKHNGSIKKSKVSKNTQIVAGDLIVTSRKSTAQLSLKDGSTLILVEKSTIRFNTAFDVEQSGGKVFYKITSRDVKNSLKIKTDFAIIGIKGTTFIINANKKDASVSLKEGLIGVTSIKEKFELYRQKVQAEFNSYVSKQKSEFQKYKDAQNKYAIAEPTKAFDLKEQHRISFFGKRVNEDKWSAKDDKDFEHFEKLLKFMK